MTPTVLLIEGCDFRGFPVGGQLTTMLQLVGAFGDRFALVGFSTDEAPVGRWIKRRFGELELDFFSIGRVDPAVTKPRIPRRLSVYLRLRWYRRRIMSLKIGAAFAVAPEVILAIQHWGLRIGFKFSGVENPLAMPRYRIGRWLARPFERHLFAAVAQRADLVVAAADAKAIEGLKARGGGVLSAKAIIPMRTRVDTAVFGMCRTVDSASPAVIVSCGRLNMVKGWDLVFEAFLRAKASIPTLRLCFVGDGEDRAKLQSRIDQAGVGDAVRITGFLPQREVAKILNTAQLFVLGSHREGWPTALVEALACGLPAVATNVSGVPHLIEEGENGFITRSRDSEEFAGKILSALQLRVPNPTSLRIGMEHAADQWKQGALAEWEPLR